MRINFKLKRLKNILSDMESVLLAYSGGVDSTFLLKVVCDVLPENKVLAVTASSATYPRDELIFAKKLAAQLKASHLIIETKELDNPEFRNNPLNRCYYCKRELFLRLNSIADKKNLKFVIDASQVSDNNDFRPGEQAKKELKVRSPLREAGFTKEDIRSASRIFDLPTWDMPSQACLASRIPYGNKISQDALRKIEGAEKLIRGLGFKQVRVRTYNGLCRIEVEKKQIPHFLSRLSEREINSLKKLGYDYVTVDLEGFRSGSMNPAIDKDTLRLCGITQVCPCGQEQLR